MNDPIIKAKANVENVKVTYTSASHIFPRSINSCIADTNEGGAKLDYAASVWAVVERFGEILVVDELNGDSIHRLENVMTMDQVLRIYFDTYWIWLMPTETMNKYQVCSRDPKLIEELPSVARLETPDPVDFPLPDPCYLALHAACAQVSHLSGAREYTEHDLRDLEEMRALAKDGSFASALKFALLRHLDI